MTAKTTAILIPITILCVCKKCLSLNLKEFFFNQACCWDRLFSLIMFFVILTDNIDSHFLGNVSVE